MNIIAVIVDEVPECCAECPCHHFWDGDLCIALQFENKNFDASIPPETDIMQERYVRFPLVTADEYTYKYYDNAKIAREVM